MRAIGRVSLASITSSNTVISSNTPWDPDEDEEVQQSAGVIANVCHVCGKGKVSLEHIIISISPPLECHPPVCRSCSRAQ